MYRPTHSTGIFGALILMLCIQDSYADSAAWNLNPGSDDWNTAANWTPNGVPNGTFPNGPFDIARFAQSNITEVSLSAETNVASIVFDANASAFTINTESQLLRLEGAGIVNNSGIAQNIVAGRPFGLIGFFNNSSAGTNVTYTIEPDPTNGQGFSGAIFFLTHLLPEMRPSSSPRVRLGMATVDLLISVKILRQALGSFLLAAV